MDPAQKQREPEAVTSGPTHDNATAADHSATTPAAHARARLLAAWEALPEEEKALRVLIAKLLGSRRDTEAAAIVTSDRPLFVTPIPGVYSGTWAVALVLRGSPPRGALLAVLDDIGLGGRVEELHLVERGRSRCVADNLAGRGGRDGSERLEIVRRFLASRGVR